VESTYPSDPKTSQSNTSYASFFKGVQDAPWYQLFLAPALDELKTLPSGSKVLDVGTGPGRFIELAQSQMPISFVGVDTDEAMLAQARGRPALANVPMHEVKPDHPLPFGDDEFDAISFCSVLFLLDDPFPLLKETFRVLKPDGKLVVLTPSGHHSLRDAAGGLSKVEFTIRNWTLFLWRKMTRFNAQRWADKRTLPEFAESTLSVYSKRFGFGSFAVIEVIQSATPTLS